MIKRAVIDKILSDIRGDKPLIRAIIGPRQVGKTTAARQIVEALEWPHIYESADSPLPHKAEWITMHWHRARKLAAVKPALLILDEIQKIANWSEEVKRLWDEDRNAKLPLTVLVLGSSALLLAYGLTESLAGRFFSYHFTHWTWSEMKSAFGWSLDKWLYFGGYPGAADFCDDEDKWKHYVNDSLIETVLARDVLQLQRINKPALLRQLFGLSTTCHARIISYNKMLGQLQDAGNTTTLAEYLRLLASSYLVVGLELFSKGVARKRASSPKIILLNNALISAPSVETFKQVLQFPDKWGWLIENAVGAHFYNSLSKTSWHISYWRKGDKEVDFVVQGGDKIFGIEVKSGRLRKTSGLEAFKQQYPQAKTLLVGTTGIPLEEFFSAPAIEWLS
ncbi:MAG: ATP-binding protein [Deltaproteobacteria bacterium]|nr:ATP-binding protein [Deltaproteobacteria bacterium]